jgi:hypothetical protein
MARMPRPDGDGWGWENNKSCIVQKTPTGTTGSCANLEGTASTMAALIVSAAQELKRWQPTKDFAIVKINNTEFLQLTATGKARCSDGKCYNTQALLDFQKDEANGKIRFPVAKSTTGAALKYPAQLENKLLWGDRENPYVAFASVGEVVSVDPTYGLNEQGTTSTGTCMAACARVSATNIAGSCCSCNGTTKTFIKSPWSATTYLCQ